MASGFHVAFFLCLTGGLLISGTWSAKIERRSAGCPSGWTRSGSRCFIVESRAVTTADAERACIHLGGNLASIHSYSELRVITDLIHRTIGSSKSAWIGLNDAIQERRWMWTDGTRVSFTFWDSGEPNDKGGEDCVETNFRGRMSWNDESCGSHRPFVCARRV